MLADWKVYPSLFGGSSACACACADQKRVRRHTVPPTKYNVLSGMLPARLLVCEIMSLYSATISSWTVQYAMSSIMTTCCSTAVQNKYGCWSVLPACSLFFTALYNFALCRSVGGKSQQLSAVLSNAMLIWNSKVRLFLLWRNFWKTDPWQPLSINIETTGLHSIRSWGPSSSSPPDSTSWVSHFLILLHICTLFCKLLVFSLSFLEV